MGLAIVKMAGQQVELERKVNRAHSHLDLAVIMVKAIDQRLTNVEKKLTTASHITDDQAQAAKISVAVKSLAEYLKSKAFIKNHFQAIFTEI